jgi:hypothetical protein
MVEHVNSIILKPGGSMREKLECAARLWLASGGSADRLLTGVAFFTAQCWLSSIGNDLAHGPRSDKTIADFVAASKAAIGGEAGWNALLAEKTFCSVCHMSFHLENIGICTGCMEYVCGACQAAHNGCGGEVVG